MSAPYFDEQGRLLPVCPDCRGLGYVVDLIGEVRPCRREECVKKKAVEILEEGHAAGDGSAANPFGGLKDMLKGNTEFRKLAMPFVMGGIAGVVAKMGSEILEKAMKEEKTKGANPFELPPLLGPPPGSRRAKKKPSRRKSSR